MRAPATRSGSTGEQPRPRGFQPRKHAPAAARVPGDSPSTVARAQDFGRGPHTQMVLRRTDRKPWPPSVLAKLAKANTVQCEVGAATQRLHEHSEADIRITPRYDAIAPQLREKLNSRNGM